MSSRAEEPRTRTGTGTRSGTSPRSVRHGLLAALACVPLLVGAAVAATSGPQPAESLSADGAQLVAPIAGDSAAASAVEAGGVAGGGVTAAAGVSDLRRAAIDAGTNASFLASGTAQLTDGTGKLRSGGDQLAAGVTELNDGSTRLADGMTKLQAATGQLGAGATRLADSVGGAIDSIATLGVIKGQLADAAANLDKDLAASRDPKAADLRAQLDGFRTQLDNAPLDGEIAHQLTELKDGSRELANQLAVPGYGFHDGIYTATDGAKKLSGGLHDLHDGVGHARDGLAQLDDGARRLDAMAKDNRTRVQSIQRSIPGASPVADADSASPPAALSPQLGLLILALSGAAAAAAGVLAYRRRRADAAITALCAAALAPVLAAIFGEGLGAHPGVLAGVTGVAARLLAATRALSAQINARAGRGARPIIAAGQLLQLAVASWLWTTPEPAVGVRALAGALPLHWASLSTSAFVHSGTDAARWVGVLLLAATAVVGATAVLLGGARRRGSVAPAPAPR